VSSAFSGVDLCSRALLLATRNVITSFDDASQDAVTARTIYEQVIEEITSEHPWNFAGKVAALTELAETPPADWEKVFAVPSDCLRVLSCGSASQLSTTGVEYEVMAGKLYCSATDPIIWYSARMPEASWPAFFRKAVVYRLASEFAISCHADPARITMLVRLAEGHDAKARNRDAQEGRSRGIDASVFTAVRE
jgi:hypothetical protein